MIKSIIITLLYVFCFCPFLFPIKALGTDLQFYAFILSFVYLIINFSHIHLSSIIKVFGIYAFAAIIIAMFSTGTAIQAISCLFQYLSLFIICISIYTLLINEKGINERLCKILILTWFSIGSIQTFITPDFLNGIIANTRSSLDRGVCGLASEPSFFGIQCFYFLYIAFRFKTHRIHYCALIMAMAFFYAQSFTGLMMAGAVAILLFCDRVSTNWFRFKYVCVGIIVILAVAFYVNRYFQADRLEMLMQLAYDRNIQDLSEDESANVRLYAIIDAIHNSYDNNFMPIGFTVRVGSMFGGIIQEFGIFGLPLTYAICSSFIVPFRRKLIKILAFIILYLLFFVNMQMANPMLAFIIALNIYEDKW